MVRHLRQITPLYEQIAQSLMEDIQNGHLAPGSKLPTEGELLEKFNVSRITIRQALALLQKNKLIKRFRRRGTFVTDNPEFPKPETSQNGSALRVIQFFHIGFSKATASTFAKGEVDAAERHFSKSNRIMAWSTMTSSEIMRGKVPSAIETGQCAGLIVDGLVSDPHLQMLDNFKLPMVVIGSHDIGAGWHQVRYDAGRIARQCVAAIQEAGASDLIVIDSRQANYLQKEIPRHLLLALSEAGLPPLRTLPEEALMRPDFPGLLDRMAPVCAFLVLEHQISGLVADLRKRDPKWCRYRLLVVDWPQPQSLPFGDDVIRIALDPALMACKGAEMLENLLHRTDKIQPQDLVLDGEIRIPERFIPSS